MSTKNNKNINFDYKIIALLIIIVLIISYFLFFKDLLKNKNIKKEEEMVEKAKDYVLKNNISTTKEIYFDVSMLNIELEDRCSITSGVIYDGISYIPNLVCNDYQSIVIKSNNNIKEFITLIGNDVMIIPKGMMFYDPGYISNDAIITAGNVGTEEGVYNIYYKTANSNNFAIRKVIVIDNSLISNLFPTVALNGDEIVYVIEGSTYTELGATGMDNVDGNISNRVVVNSNVNTNQIGEYKVTYVLTNSRGYSSTVIRKVNVIDRNSNLVVDYSLNPTNLTNGNVTIKLSISSDFNKIIYPDGRDGTNLEYIVSENGRYKFSIYDTYGRIINKEIEISNIDKTIPQGTCNAILKYSSTEIKVNITTTREISSYEYIIDGVSSKSTQTNSYISNISKPNEIKVIVKDSLNNKNEIICEKEDKSTREIVTDAKGKNCLEGTTCYIQFNYGNSKKYPFCSKQNNPNSCGGIGRNGCSITSATNAIAFFGIKSSSGALYTPYTVWEELYPINKNTGECGGGCSGWSKIRTALINAGLSAPVSYAKFNKNEVSKILEHLKKGYPVIIRAEGRPFSEGGAHYMTLLAVRDDNYVYLSDSANRSGTKKYYINGQQYYVDTWIPTDDLVTGHVADYLLVGPRGMFEG